MNTIFCRQYRRRIQWRYYIIPIFFWNNTILICQTWIIMVVVCWLFLLFFLICVLSFFSSANSCKMIIVCNYPSIKGNFFGTLFFLHIVFSNSISQLSSCLHFLEEKDENVVLFAIMARKLRQIFISYFLFFHLFLLQK